MRCARSRCAPEDAPDQAQLRDSRQAGRDEADEDDYQVEDAPPVAEEGPEPLADEDVGELEAEDGGECNVAAVEELRLHRIRHHVDMRLCDAHREVHGDDEG